MPFSRQPEKPLDHVDNAFLGFSPLNWAVGILLVLALVRLAFSQFLLFHTLVEIFSILVAWSTFILLWNGRRYIEDKSFLVLGVALFLSGGIDILHTLAYKGMGVFPANQGANLSTQLWIAGRTVEMLGWAGLVFLRNRPRILGPASAGLALLSALMLLLIFQWERFPRCFVPGQGLTPFKVVMEYGFVLVIAASLINMVRNRQHYLPPVYRDITAALALLALGELAFTLYIDIYGISNVTGHLLRLVSRFLSYRALVQLSFNRPYHMFFKQLQKERDQVAAAENLLRSITHATTDHITDLDPDLRIRFVNYPAPGLGVDDLLGTSILDHLPPQDVDRVEKVLREAMATRQAVTYETRFDVPDGSTIHFETHASCRLNDQDEVQGLTLVSRNVSDRMRRDQLFAARLRISEYALTHTVPELLTKVLDEAEALTNSHIGFFHFVHENQKELQLQAWSTNTLNNMCTAEGHGAHYDMEKAGVWADCLRQGAPLIHNDYPALPNKRGMPEGHAVVLREAVVPITRKGRHVAVFGVGNKETPYGDTDLRLLTELGDLAWDIVVRKRTEVILQESERRMAQTMANLPGMVFRCANDEQWTMKFVSEGCQELTGYLAQDLIDNRAVSYASIIHPEDRDQVNKGVQLGLESHTPYQIVYRIIDANGHHKWVWEQGRGLWQGDTLESIEGFIYDISEQIEAREERQAMEKRVLETQKLESLGVLAGGIAHDFNNLLQAMLGFAEMARLELPDHHPARESLGMVMDSAAKAAGLTRQMLAFSGKGQFSVTQVDLSRQVQEMAELLESSVPKYVEFHRDLMEHLPAVQADEAQLQQVVMNLITNAAEAIGENKGQIYLRTGKIHCDDHCLARNLVHYEADAPAPTPGEFVFLEVQDTGCGMEPAVLKRVFEPFFTTKFTGRGLGMAAVQGIIKGHRGAMIVETAPGQGSVFRVLLPTSAHSAGDQPDMPALESHATRRTGNVLLVVDDDDRVRDLVAMSLGKSGYQVQLAADGQEGLDIFGAAPEKIACVLLDLIMPRMGGKECLARMLELDPGVPVVIMSGYSESEIQDRLADMPTAGILAKPFHPDQLKEVLDRVVPRDG